jgi:hypothetical protein
MDDKPAGNLPEAMADTQVEWADGTIVQPKPEEFAFACDVRLDDGRMIEVLVPRDQFLPGPTPQAGDRVSVIVHSGLCLA